MTKHIILDLETLGTKPGDLVFAVGAVAFDDNDRFFNKTFHRYISIAASASMGFRVESETLDWWRKQPDSVEFTEASSMYAPSPDFVVKSFDLWYREVQGEDEARPKIWGNGKEFDNEMLKRYFQVCKVPIPWTFREDMDFRTVRALFSDLKPIEDNERPHNSLADAKYEGTWLQNIITFINATK